jgi:hypothetical protein
VTVRPVLDVCPALRTCSCRVEMRPSLRFGAAKVPDVRLVLRRLSLGLNECSVGGLHLAPQDPCRKRTGAPKGELWSSARIRPRNAFFPPAISASISPCRRGSAQRAF